MRNIFYIIIALFIAACGNNLKEKAANSEVFKQEVIDQATLDSIARARAIDDSLLTVGPRVLLKTSVGNMMIKLYDKTPLHRDNFLKLAAQNFYNGTKFHRVMKGFMIQGGDPNSRNNDPRDDGLGGPGYTIPAEFIPGLIHKRGALAAAREGDAVNPKQESSGSQFYIVDGKQYPLNDDIFYNFNTPEEDRKVYHAVGGTPMLDRAYTVFGEVVSGFDVMEKIAGARVKPSENNPSEASVPVNPVTILGVEILGEDE